MPRNPLDDAAMNEIIATNGYAFPKDLGDRIAALMPLIFTTAIITLRKDESSRHSYEDRWCYHTPGAAIIALANWDGTGEPEGWHRHPASGRRRDEGGEERIAP